MKKLIKLSFAVGAIAMTLTGCNCFKQMAKEADQVKIVSTPEVLALSNGQVAAEITVDFPAEFFEKKAIVKVTPVLVYQGGEVAAPAKMYQGEKVKDNYIVITPEGGKQSVRVVFDYIPAMQQSELQLRAEFSCNNSDELTYVNLNTGEVATKSESAVLAQNDAAAAALKKEFGLTVAYGVNTIQKDFNFGEIMTAMPTDYKRVTTSVETADLIYSINSSRLKSTATKTEQIDGFKSNVEANTNNDRASQSIAIKGYASPDGPVKFNDKLSQARSESGKKALEKLFADLGLELDAAAYGEDWEGFKELVQNSDIKDKAMILQVLSLYNSPAEREAQIKNMAAVFGDIKEDILPQLRRAQVVNTIDLQGKTDAEIMAAFKAGDALTAEEYLHAAATLASSASEQVAILTDASRAYPQDARIYNNLAVAHAAEGNTAAAKGALSKAAQYDAPAGVMASNMTAASLMEGNYDEAKKYAMGANADAKAAVAASQGDYSQAAQEFSGYNKAIAEFMNNNYSSAKMSIANDKSADADYLRAVIASNEGDMNVASSQLKSAISKDASLAQKATTDVNLRNLFESGFKL